MSELRLSTSVSRDASRSSNAHRRSQHDVDTSRAAQIMQHIEHESDKMLFLFMHNFLTRRTLNDDATNDGTEYVDGDDVLWSEIRSWCGLCVQSEPTRNVCRDLLRVFERVYDAVDSY